MKITGTFLDEITHDIPSQNWGPKEWRKEFELYSKIGIDMVTIIRSGYQNKCIFQAKSLPDLLPVYVDLGRVFLDLAEEFNISLYWGTYDSGWHWHRGSWWDEVEINKKFIDEVVERYGDSPAFKGWYLCHETSSNSNHIIELFNHIGKHCKQAKDLPVLISPYPQGAKQFAGNWAFSLKESFDHWDRIFADTHEVIDICAFQDGQVHYQELPQFVEGILNLGTKYGVTIWSNLETFDRDMPIKFPPADWRYLQYKLESAKATEKIITFEFPHFMSPNSCYPAAHNLFNRYAEYAGIEI